jgi:hypothetical protein
VADKPEGPYQDVNVALPAYSDTAWDGAMTHNPYMVKTKGKYYLYYIATSGRRLASDEKLQPYGKEWWTRRNTQRIGVAVADNPAGPWKRARRPVLDVGEHDSDFDALCVTNPAVCVGRNGKIIMLYKAVCKSSELRGGKVRFSVAFANSPTGPFVKTGKLIFQPDNQDAQMVAEDPYIWYDKHADLYFAIVRDVIGQFTGEDSGGLALMQSIDAINWKPTKFPKVLPAILHWADGTTYNAHINHVERPFLYFDKTGRPALLFGAMGIDRNGIHREHSFNVRIPLGMNKK